MIETKYIQSYTGEPDKDRILSTFRREPVDRVPNFENLIEDKHVEKILGRYAGNTLAIGGDPAKGAGSKSGRPMYPDDYIDLCNIIGQDAMRFEAGFWTPFKKEDENGKLIQVADRSIKNRKDFDSIILDSENQIKRAVGYVKEYKQSTEKRKSKIAVGCVFGCLLETLYDSLVGMKDFMMMVYEDRGFVEHMLEVSTIHFSNLCKAVVEAGVDFVWIADDIAFKTGLFIPPKLFKEIWTERMQRIMEPALARDIPVIFHSDGNIDDIIEDLIDIGISCLNPMDPYAVDYKEYKKRYGSRLCLSGNMDIELLAKGTPEDIEKDVKKHMDILKPGGGYIATCSHSLVNYIPHNNVIAYINAIHKYGLY
jgi:uroporphyrinogen-III decarboxylase